MRIVFRADASRTIGSGHVIRCLTLAQALQARGATIAFVCREHEGHLCDFLKANGFNVTRLPVTAKGTQSEAVPSHADWLGANWQDDARQTRTAIEDFGANPDWLIVDHYALDHRWETALRGSARQIMAIDDLADRVHDCDLLLDQNLVAQMHTRYNAKVPAACGLLLGPEYALLQPIYAELHDRTVPREGPIRRIFVFFGGADSDNLTGRTLTALLRLNRLDIEIDVVIANGSPHAHTIRQQVEGHDNIHWYSGLPTLAALMVKADLAIGGGGATSWERLCLRLPSIVVTLAANQIPVSNELEQKGLIRWLGSTSDASEASLAEALTQFLCTGVRPGWLSGYENLVDGQGTRRVCDSIMFHRSPQSSLEPENYE